jgi:hypothetical protein
MTLRIENYALKLARRAPYHGCHCLYGITQDAISDRPQRLPAAQRHRAIILQAQKLASLAARYDRLARNYIAAIALAAIIVAWIN